jgi:regulatory protein YycI of two-component signal transduction system YycFG
MQGGEKNLSKEVRKMNYIDTINGYDIYELTMGTCLREQIPYPCFMCYGEHESDRIVGYEECSMDTFEELAEWCENN